MYVDEVQVYYHLPKDLPLRPAHVMDPGDGPHATHVTVWVPAIERVLVIQMDGDPERLFRGGRPFKDLLRPIHP